MNQRYDADATMTQVWLHLVRDFRNAHGQDYASGPERAFLQGGIKGLRAYNWPARAQAPTYIFKTEYQLENLMKRYIYKDDVFNSEELYDKTVSKFLETQSRIASPFGNSLSIFRVLQKARTLCKRVLGEYIPNEHADLCYFGKRACAGHPYARSYLDLKLKGPLTGSKDHIAWFKNHIRGDKLLHECIDTCAPNGTPIYTQSDTLTLSLVPKSYKSLRIIKPPTLLGSFYTGGLGRLIQKKLCKVGLNIRTLQNKHRDLARLNSKSRRLVTADLSAASDSVSRELLRKVLPLPWYRAVMLGRLQDIVLDGTQIQCQTVIAMGDGDTFPLQTLIFYCLLKAIGELGNVPLHYVSVYGDDLIYHRQIHKFVKWMFPKIHLHLNLEKTYAKDNFRESCGGDYYRGSDVRPYQPEGGGQLLSRQCYTVYLYKLCNGLRQRWSEVEIPHTLNYLQQQLLLVSTKILQVPPSFPDGSGFKVDRPIYDNNHFEPVMYARTSCSYVFKYIARMADQRYVPCQFPYYWETLRSKHSVESIDPWSEGDEPFLQWRRARKPPLTVPTLIGRQKRLIAFVASKTEGKLVTQKGSSSSWT